MNEDLQLRMYFLVPYNLSPIQQGIQAGHACQQYAYLYGHTELFKNHSVEHKTWIILNGGTTRESDVRGNTDSTLGTMQTYLLDLEANTKVKIATFEEPDLNYALTAFCFICDERVWNSELYPDFVEDPDLNVSLYNRAFKNWVESIGGRDNAYLRLFLKTKRLA